METLLPDVAFSAFKKQKSHLDSLSSTTNEATTRIHAINTILFDVLDWQKEDVESEQYCRAEGYADYVCSADNYKLLVIEAKRAGTPFIFPSESLETRPYSFGFIASESKQASEALQQAIGYAATLGAHYVAITNGSQWLITLTFVEGKDLNDRLVYVFESSDAIESRFRIFLKCFSKSQLSKHAIDAELLDVLLKPAPPKVSAKIPGYPQAAIRNIYQNELAYILDYVWQVMAQEENSADFVTNCYVNPVNHKDTIVLVRELLAKRMNEDSILTKHEILSIDKLPQQIAHLPSEKPFVILGEVGRGKTSFLKYLRHVAARDLLGKFIQIDLNFLDRPDNVAELSTYVYNEIERQLLEVYQIDIQEDSFVRGVLHSELKRLKNTPYGKATANDSEAYKTFELSELKAILSNRHNYLTRVFHHLKKGRGYSLALFMDNLDRREIGLQEQAFLRASAMARDWASIIFISLRLDTFYHSQERGVLDSIAPTTFTVSHPDLALVLKKRFAYARSIANGEVREFPIAPESSVNVHFPSVAKIFESCEFAAQKRHGIIPLLEAVSNGNIRRMLDFSRDVLCSGHLDTKKILEIIEKDGHYTVPDFEGVKTLLYGEYNHYSALESPFINLFDIVHARKSEHFLPISVLHYLSRSPHDGPTRGFTDYINLQSYLSGLGFSLHAIKACISKFQEKQLISPSIKSIESVRNTLRYRITALGNFHLHHLTKVFQYIDAMTLDTPILDSDVRSAMKDTVIIQERIERTQSFLSYLDGCVSEIPDGIISEFWKEASTAIRQNMKEIESKILRNNTLTKRK